MKSDLTDPINTILIGGKYEAVLECYNKEKKLYKSNKTKHSQSWVNFVYSHAVTAANHIQY